MSFIKIIITFTLSFFSLSQDPLVISNSPWADFGIIAPPANSTVSLNLNNPNVAIDFQNLSISGMSGDWSYTGGSFPGTGGTCATTIVSGASCTIEVQFSPSSLGLQKNTILLEYDAMNPDAISMFEERELIGGGGSASACTMLPQLDNISPSRVTPSTTNTITITGNYFEAATTITIPGLVVNNIVFISPTQMTADVTSTAALSLYDVTVQNECGPSTFTSAFEVLNSTWLDMRIAADVLTANPQVTAGQIAFNQTANGLQLNPTGNDWNRSIKFQGACGSVTGNTFEIVVFRTGTVDRAMFGLINQATSVSPWPGTLSYQRQYIGAWNYGNGINRFYGSQVGEGGTFWSQGTTTVNTTAGTYIKYKYINAGQSGNAVEVWSVDATFNELTLLASMTSGKPATTATDVCLHAGPFDGGLVDYFIVGLRVE